MAGTAQESSTAFDVRAIRRDFPCLDQSVRGKPLVYLDSAATAQRPKCVIDAVSGYYSEYNASVHRGVHLLGAKATDAFEAARATMRRFLNAQSDSEIVVTKGCSEGLNLVASSWGSANLTPGDEILLSNLEHHSNIVPWQMVAQRTGAKIRVIPIDDAGDIRLDAFGQMLGPKTKVVGLMHVSNAIGTINPLKQMIRMAHEVRAITAVDGAQAAPHLAVDVQDLDADFYAIAGHKMYGPTGVGVLYGKLDLLKAIPPYQGGGSMIKSVSFERTEFADPPTKFEAGTPPIAEFVGLGAAADYVSGAGSDRIATHEQEVAEYGRALLREIEGVTLIGSPREQCGIISFLVEGVHPHDVGTILDMQGVAVRAGHHCAQPLMERLGLPATVRASLGMYSTREEMEALAEAVKGVKEVFS